ncbi:MAG: PH domain-containing protein [Prevotellaceae bacterium]|nr:PH domain-containing protein [Prevotellaceae bacterium]MDO4932298.1 PH domain-containing protein [Prevotellaceae bacterium]
MDRKVYRSRYGMVVIMSVFALVAIEAIVLYHNSKATYVAVAAVVLVLYALMLRCEYIIDGGTLAVRSHIVLERIDIKTIRRIEPSNSFLSAPAMSTRRIRISYGRYDEILISPVRQDEFIRELLRVNPDIVVAV